MDGALTRGQPAALAAATAMLRGRVPHAILLVGPGGAGKTTLALDLAAALLCELDDGSAKPCRACRACRMLASGNHPDLHRLGPSGAGGQIGIGGPDRPRGVRDLVAELALLPVEGGFRIAIIEDAHRLNEDAQSALLKTLEEPPNGVVLLLCAEEEDRLLPTVRSRCARIRLGPVSARDIEGWLVELGVADGPRAARLARIAGGRPGVALAYARAPDAETARAEIVRRLLDMREARPALALATGRDLIGRATDLARSLEAVPPPDSPRASPGRAGYRAARRRTAGGGDSDPPVPSTLVVPSGLTASIEPGAPPPAGSEMAELPSTGARLSAPERRRAALVLIRTWHDVARDLALVGLGAQQRVRDLTLLDELEVAVGRRAPDSRAVPGAFLRRLARAAELVEGNVSPELAIDVLALAWRRDGRPAGPA
jgi:DNA polymerase-3 subunit delta'